MLVNVEDSPKEGFVAFKSGADGSDNVEDSPKEGFVTFKSGAYGSDDMKTHVNSTSVPDVD